MDVDATGIPGLAIKRIMGVVITRASRKSSEDARRGMHRCSLVSLDGEGTKSALHVHAIYYHYYTLASSCFESLFFSSFLVVAVFLRWVALRLDDLCDKARCRFKTSCAGLRRDDLARLRGDSAD